MDKKGQIQLTNATFADKKERYFIKKRGIAFFILLKLAFCEDIDINRFFNDN